MILDFYQIDRRKMNPLNSDSTGFSGSNIVKFNLTLLGSG